VINSTHGAQHFAHAVVARLHICYEESSRKGAAGVSRYPDKYADKPI